MMRIFYDTEFLEDGKTIDLISIGMIRETDWHYYAIVKDDDLISRAWEHPWLRENVIPSLPVRLSGVGAFWEWDRNHPDAGCVKSRADIACEVADFIRRYPGTELWADYAAYDHVALCQLYGRMIDLPAGVPMWTHDLRQELERCGSPEIPPAARRGQAHNAIDDAREGLRMLRWLTENFPSEYQP